MKNPLRKLLATALVAGSLFVNTPVDAEIRTYEGTDEYIMSEFETIDVAKQRAKQVSLVKRVIDVYYPEAVVSPKLV